MLIIFFILFAAVGQNMGEGQSFNRLNLGVIFKPIRTVNVQTASTKLIFVVDLPEYEPLKSHRLDCLQLSLNFPSHNGTARHRTNQCRALHKPITAIFKAQETIVLSILRNIHALHDMVNVIDVSDRSRRSWFPQVGQVYNKLFGLTDEYTFESLKKVVKHLE